MAEYDTEGGGGELSADDRLNVLGLDLPAFGEACLDEGGIGDGADGTQDPAAGLVDQLEGVPGEEGTLHTTSGKARFDVAECLLLGQRVDRDGDRIGQRL